LSAHAAKALEVVSTVGREDQHHVGCTRVRTHEPLLVRLSGGPLGVFNRNSEVLIAVGPDHLKT